MNNEIYSYLYEELLRKGALDVYTSSIYMKKNRPAIKLSVLCEKENFEKIKLFILKETSTFGIRFTTFKREILDRKFKKINTKYGEITIKVGILNNEIIKVTLEYEECKKIAKNLDIPLIKVYEELKEEINKYKGIII